MARREKINEDLPDLDLGLDNDKKLADLLEKNKRMKYAIYAAAITMIIVAFILGTVTGFYGTMKFYSASENCQPISCPNEYTCEPGKVCSFNKCELCSSSPILKLTHGGE
jgi:hypothetical protein